ncbi:FAD-dependent oxidoreductase [Nocardioides soli]|uniref:Succinate dehydrogenase/fumarate reductase flavoprotein subunit n=1 Tax=Nocardioides soli TaxID=1036020 RepID=A0A7W4Z1A0_9ACTN|nr:FAD-dependent oxidoreductase [Nocardioides soli]MBB3043174.1 succinate dehydrogenase/fumarate reductase flavoprotein subunit [Nocardioides soli]
MAGRGFDSTHDVVVLGSGCAGMVSALAAADAGADVALLEKADLLGGTTALSSGVAWLPGNRYQADHGVIDSAEDGRAYLAALSNGMILPEFTDAFVSTVDEMLEWTEQRTPLRMQLVPGYPDYHPEFPGGKPSGGRSTEPALFSFHQLGEWADRFLGDRRSMHVGETPVGGGTGFLAPEEEERRAAQRLEGLGRGLLGALLKGLLDHGVRVETGAEAVRLVTADGRVTGVELADGTTVGARRGVVLATGGFERDPDLVTAFLRGPLSHSPGAPTNTGDGLRMAMRVGAQLGAMREAWWVPVVTIPGFEGEQYSGRGVQLVQRERTLPRTIMVNAQGRRFTNEAANYNALGAAFHVFHPTRFTYENQPAWVVLDQGFLDEYGGYGVPAGQVPEWLERADTVEELAERIGVPPRELRATVDRWNELCARGHDDDHQRGDSAYDGWCGDRSRYPGPMSTLGPIDRAPYYAAPIHASSLGTKGGPRTTVDCEVLDVDGDVIPGLWAVGNAMAAPTGMVYGGAGGTLGPAMVFGYRCGRSVAGAPSGSEEGR